MMFRVFTIFSLMVLTFPALAQQPPSSKMPAMANSHSPADQAMMDGMSRMNRDMSSAPMTGDPDGDFVAMMMPHHQGAIEMAKIELQYGKDPGLRKMARDIVAAQEREIVEMKAWQTHHPGH